MFPDSFLHDGILDEFHHKYDLNHNDKVINLIHYAVFDNQVKHPAASYTAVSVPLPTAGIGFAVLTIASARTFVMLFLKILKDISLYYPSYRINCFFCTFNNFK